MEQRKSSGSSWPWKKKSSKTQVTVASPKHQTMADSYQQQGTRMSLQEQHPGLSSKDVGNSQQSEENANNEKLSQSLSEAVARKNLVQHAKVAEEAVSGWQIAEAEAAAYRKQLDEALQQKAAMEDRLQECTKQLLILREEQEKTVEDAIINKVKECDKIRMEMESKLADAEHQLLEGEAENNVMLRSLQERTRAIAEITEEKVKAEGELLTLQIKMNTVEKENSRLKYEVHLLNKELEIRTDERECSKKANEISHKQHAENVKKITKLETECQRLRELVRKKVPIPVDFVACHDRPGDQGPRRRSSSRSLDNEAKKLAHQMSMEEETRLLKETLAKRNNELQLAKARYGRTPSNLSSVEGQIESASTVQKQSNKQKPPTTLESQLEVLRSASFDLENNLARKSDGSPNDGDDVSCAESWASAMIAELAHFKKENGPEHDQKVIDISNLGMVDYFTEVESVASCSEIKNEEKQFQMRKTQKDLETSYGKFSSEKSTVKQNILGLHDTNHWVKHAKDTVSSKVDGTVGSRFCISVTEIVKLVEALAHPLLYCIKMGAQDGKSTKDTNNTAWTRSFSDCKHVQGWKDTNACELSESDLQLHIDKLVEIKEKAVEVRSNVSWVVVDFLEELAGVLNRLVKIVLYRNAQKDGCSDDDYDDNVSEMSGITSITQRQIQIRESYAKGNSLSFDNVPPSSLGHRINYSLWKDNEDENEKTKVNPLTDHEEVSKFSVFKNQVESPLKNADQHHHGEPGNNAQNEGKHNQDFMAKYKEIQKELKMDSTEGNVIRSHDHLKNMETGDETKERKNRNIGKQSKALTSSPPDLISTRSKDLSSSFVEKKVEKEGFTSTPKLSTGQHSPHPHPSLNSKHLITPYNAPTSSMSSKFFDFNSKYLKTTVRSTISKTMNKTDATSKSTILPQKPKSSNKLLTRLLSLG